MTIPASSIVSIKPGVIQAGGAGLVLNGLFLTGNPLMYTGSVLSFATSTAVAGFFGLGSAEYSASQIYFNGYNGASITPSAMLFAPYAPAATHAFINSASFAGVPLATIQSYNGTLTFTVDGTVETSSAINLSTATSFSNAASIIQAAFTLVGFAVAYNAIGNYFQFTSPLPGPTSTITFATGTLASNLKLTQATGAVLSQGSEPDTPITAMQNAVTNSQNWLTMVTLFEPDLADKQTFGTWFSSQNDQYLWLAWDSDAQASVNGATEPFGVLAKTAAYDGVACIGGDPLVVTLGNTLASLVMNAAIFVSGAIASINTLQTNGRVTLAFLSQTGLLPTCSNEQTAANLLANGYSFYGAYATRNQGFTFFYNGAMPGTFSWIDTFVDDAWMNDQAAVDLMTLLTNVGSDAYNAQGYGLIRTALTGGMIAAALNFGAIRTGVTLSATQIAEVNQLAGQVVNNVISTLGYYLQIQDPGAVVRQLRGSPIIKLFYTDGGSIQNIDLSSLDII
jgi:hypothetical protein